MKKGRCPRQRPFLCFFKAKEDAVAERFLAWDTKHWPTFKTFFIFAPLLKNLIRFSP
jgi:hypothetical protein